MTCGWIRDAMMFGIGLMVWMLIFLYFERWRWRKRRRKRLEEIEREKWDVHLDQQEIGEA